MSAQNGESKGTLIVCQSSQGLEVHAQVLRVTRHLAIFEIYNPTLVLRTSEVLSEFRIVAHERTIYSGRAVIRNLINTGMVLVCEVALEDNAWMDVEFNAAMIGDGRLASQFQGFFHDWEKQYRIVPEYKVIIADMQTYFSDLKLWLDQVELGIRATPSFDRLKLEQQVVDELAQPIVPCVNVLFEKFEVVAQGLRDEVLPAHRNFMRRQLHPLVLCSPFAHRTFQKPLGYAGDYEMINMILRNRHEGGSLFAKVVNTWFLRQPPAEAHRNRIGYLTEALATEVLRARRSGHPARICSLGCGPAHEVQAFLTTAQARDNATFSLIDFSDEALQNARSTIESIRRAEGAHAAIEYTRKSVQQILKESGRTIEQPKKQYDFVYCAGLFDYLSDQICRRLLGVMFEWLAPGGLLLVTNVEPSNPLRNGMEHLLDWHLIYRTSDQLRALQPSRALPDSCRVVSDKSGVNLFLEIRKPENA